jgi:acyl-CoA reductase-like NAD-dependent aldehyde dehydrogenase
MLKLADLMEANKEELALAESKDNGLCVMSTCTVEFPKDLELWQRMTNVFFFSIVNDH